MFKSKLLLVAFSLMATSASAQDIRWKSEKATPGDYVSVEQSKGGLIHHVYAGRKGKDFVLKSYRGAQPAGEPVFVTYLDKDGNYRKWVRADGFEIKYRPHDCTRTLGQCTYKEVHSDGRRKKRTRVTEATKNGLAFKEYDESGAFLFGGRIALDAWGWRGDGTVDGNRGKQKFRLAGRSFDPK
ncbi:hypothetical protein [Shimia sp. R9_3]|uniref:hypothetical protein n=1 Tax=Shimia sp. R9_3 TaxID=2821113 RepID=UPI001ADB41B2|nr:hypothetical protein [Shimia sp. R9_3]